DPQDDCCDDRGEGGCDLCGHRQTGGSCAPHEEDGDRACEGGHARIRIAGDGGHLVSSYFCGWRRSSGSRAFNWIGTSSLGPSDGSVVRRCDARTVTLATFLTAATGGLGQRARTATG